MPWEPFGFVGIGGPPVEMNAGRFLLQAARRRGRDTVLLSLQVVEVREGQVATVRVPGKFPPRADGEDGMYVLTYPC